LAAAADAVASEGRAAGADERAGDTGPPDGAGAFAAAEAVGGTGEVVDEEADDGRPDVGAAGT